MKHVLVALFLSCLALPAAAAPVAKSYWPETIKRAEAYLNARTSFTAKFLQATQDGQVATGTLLVSRPGKMNLSYDPPLKDMIIADGSFVYLWDGELQQSTTLPLGGSLADLILRANLRLSGDVEVANIDQEPGRLEITVRQAHDRDQGSMVLIFEDRPMVFRGWRVIDAQGRATTVTLQNVQENVTIAARSFVFVSPTLGASGRTDNKQLHR